MNTFVIFCGNEAVFVFLKALKNKKAENRFFYILQVMYVVLSENKDDNFSEGHFWNGFLGILMKLF
jgi:hypothetical protein